jgi:HD-like signal output (HDOD) protein
MATPTQDPGSDPGPVRPVHMFGPLQILRLLGKTERTTAWRVVDTRTRQHLLLVLPRVQPATSAVAAAWEDRVRRAARLQHPELAPVVMSGIRDGWPYVAHDLGESRTLAERLGEGLMSGTEAAGLTVQLLQGLAFAHEAGVAHADLQSHLVLVSPAGQLRLAGTAVGLDPDSACEPAERTAPTSAAGLREHRGAAERDVLACGLLLHQMLAGSAALPDPDLGRCIAALPPWCSHSGREFIRLPWTLPTPVAEPLRAIVNRATERQARLRYRSARTLQRALEGWLRAEGDAEAGALALLLDRIETAGVLPSLPGAAANAARLALMERQRTSALAELVLQDFALSFELLRLVNAGPLRSQAPLAGAPVLTMRRAIAMLGLEGVRRAALGLRPWPGPLGESAAGELRRQMARVSRAGRLAVLLRPAGYDPEVVYLVTVLQDLGRLMVQYHFPEEAAQIRRLTQPGPAVRTGETEEPGMTEQAASFAVLGIDVNGIGPGVGQRWGLDEAIIFMSRRLSADSPVRMPDDDPGWLRTTASCAHEVIEILDLPAARMTQALARVLQRYGRILGLEMQGLRHALEGSADASSTLGVSDSVFGQDLQVERASTVAGGFWEPAGISAGDTSRRSRTLSRS